MRSSRFRKRDITFFLRAGQQIVLDVERSRTCGDVAGAVAGVCCSVRIKVTSNAFCSTIGGVDVVGRAAVSDLAISSFAWNIQSKERGKNGCLSIMTEFIKIHKRGQKSGQPTG